MDRRQYLTGRRAESEGSCTSCVRRRNGQRPYLGIAEIGAETAVQETVVVCSVAAGSRNIHDSCLEDAVIGGIADENIARTIRSKKYNDIDELYAAMHEMGSMPRATEPKIIPRPVAYQRGPMNKTVPTASTSTAKLTSSTPAEATQRPSIVCFNCGTVGHISVKSPKTAVICKSCDKKGHLDRFCSRPKRVNATQEIRDSSPKHWRMDDRG
ncbi:uncharacterized protein LOC128888082 isoform X2 [Hylaeus anthracinus]|uniref:uncharacterized protein LOC128888082 isoform X2 n=1 Tax=Hylaeus anthracinus TaxID=313031 RepID=UPI0023BA3C7E|nr:uncharacterized protein LOC128888082 isoform X2 [Hylaeus anthracinus]